MTKRKDPRKTDLTNEEIERLVFPKKVRDAIHRIAKTDDDERESEDSKDENQSESSHK